MSVFIIAEAGVNHSGSLREAEALIVAAKRCGADCVKFQLFDAAKLGRPEIAHLQIGKSDMLGLKLYADRLGIEFMCTPFDVEALNFLVSIGVKRLKIGSGSITNAPLLDAAKRSGLPLIVSTGMCGLQEIRDAQLRNATILHCTSAYPCPPQDVNLRAMLTIGRLFNTAVGYSDHTDGIDASIAAAALGATVIEKHLTLDRNAVGPDHLSSIAPESFRFMVRAIREIELMLGDGIKRPMPSESDCMKIWR